MYEQEDVPFGLLIFTIIEVNIDKFLNYQKERYDWTKEEREAEEKKILLDPEFFNSLFEWEIMLKRDAIRSRIYHFWRGR